MDSNKEHSMWTERYRPQTLEDYVGNESIIVKVKNYIAANDVPHLLLYGVAGTGKTTLAKIIANQIDCDLMYINASDENSVDGVRDKIRGFASTVGFKDWKIIILDESDYLTHNAQAALRNLMETFSNSTRFILTCNYVEKIIDPIQSRCQEFEITPPSKGDVALRLHNILNEEGIEHQKEDLVSIVNTGYPDIRRVLRTAQSYVNNGALKLDTTSAIQANYMDHLLVILKEQKGDVKTTFNQIRKLVADSKVKNFQPLYTFLYENVDDYAGGKVGNTILNIAEYQSKDSFCVDKEIHIMALILEILMNINK